MAHQVFHAHQIADQPDGIGISLQLMQGVTPQLLSAIEGLDQLARIEIVPHPSAPEDSLTLQCIVNLLLAEALGHGDGGLEGQQLGQQPADCRCGLISWLDRDGHTTHGCSGR